MTRLTKKGLPDKRGSMEKIEKMNKAKQAIKEALNKNKNIKEDLDYLSSSEESDSDSEDIIVPVVKQKKEAKQVKEEVKDDEVEIVDEVVVPNRKPKKVVDKSKPSKPKPKRVDELLKEQEELWNKRLKENDELHSKRLKEAEDLYIKAKTSTITNLRKNMILKF